MLLSARTGKAAKGMGERLISSGLVVPWASAENAAREMGGKMTYEMDRADRYRSQAKQLRIFADMDGPARTAEMLKQAAADYEGMADMFAAMDRANRGVH